MRKSILFARSNIRRAKGQTAAVAVLVFLAAVMLNLWLMLAMDYKQNFDRCHDRLNAEHILVVMEEDTAVRKCFRDTVEKDERTTEYSIEDCLLTAGSIPYNGGEISVNLVLLEKQASLDRSVGKIEIVEEGSCTSGIYLPMIYRTGTVKLGERVGITVYGRKMEFTVCGFFNSAMAGSHNCGLTEMILTEDVYESLADTEYTFPAVICSVRVRDKSESEDYAAMLSSAVSAASPGGKGVSTSYTLVSTSRYISQMICSAIISAMAFLVLLIALIVMASNIVNYIQENMRDLGALKAVGYTGRQLVDALIIQFLGIWLLAAVLGIGVSYCLFPGLNSMMIAQTGIPYEIHFLPLPGVITLTFLCGAVCLAVWLSGRRMKRIDPILALRRGVETHSFKKNHVPLARTKAPLQLALGLKTMLSGVKQNVTVCVTMLVLSLIVVFSGVMIENIITDSTVFIHMIVGETADSCVNIAAEEEEVFLEAMAADERVEKVYLYNSFSIYHEGGAELMVTVCDDFGLVNNSDVCCQGRFPVYDNEMAVGIKYARENDLKIGDEITLAAGGQRAGYIITGYTHVTNNLGKDCLLTRQGYGRLGELQDLSFYLNLKEGIDSAEFNEDIAAEFDVNLAVDVASVVESAIEVYISLMKVIVIAVLILSLVIIVFVMYLLIRNLLSAKKQEYGVLKALGYTTGQLVLQTALSFMPMAVISTAAGIVFGRLVINPLLSIFLSGIGIVKCNFAISTGFNIAAGAGVVLAAFLSACLMSLRIRKIAPRELLVNE
ncbi:MAG: ABC transporter permease [Firmicutes bacterium]|nr:ABC transporter permease [Bacillota bacterium]